MEIGEKLSKLQQDMKVPKDQYNKFGKFYYRNAETILAEFKKYEKDLKVFLTLKDEIVEVVGKVYIKATARLGRYHVQNVQVVERFKYLRYIRDGNGQRDCG